MMLFKKWRSDSDSDAVPDPRETEKSKPDVPPAESVTPTPVAAVPAAPVAEAVSPAPDEEERARDRGLFKALLAGLYDGVLIVDSKGFVIESNQRARDFFGLSEADIWNMSCGELVPQINKKVLFKIQSHLEEGRFTVVNASCKRADGSRFPAEIAIGTISLTNDRDLILSIRNCERRDKARHRHQLQEDALLYAGAGIITCTSEGFIEYANPAFLRLLMAEEEQDVLQHCIGDFCEDAGPVAELMRVPSQSGAWYGRLDLKTLRGTRQRVQATSALAERHGKGGAPTLIVTMTLIPDAAVSVSEAGCGEASV